jgi:hypothetical protein
MNVTFPAPVALWYVPAMMWSYSMPALWKSAIDSVSA